jgi:carboxyl-terminal processing protease
MGHRQPLGVLSILSMCLSLHCGHAAAAAPDQGITAVPNTLRLNQQSAPPALDADDQLTDQPQAAVEDVPIEQIQNFIEAFQLIKHNYVAAVDDDVLFENAMHGLAEQLDPYSRYLDAAHYKQLVEFTEGQIAKPQFDLKFNDQQNNWKITGVARNSENYRLGLRDGQLVERINGINIQTLDLRTVKNLLTGALGSVLSIRVKANAQVQVVDVIRDQKLNYDVQASLSDNRILILRIKAFQQDTTQQVMAMLQHYQKKELRGLLIDIRDNPGGLLSAAVDLADVFLEQGLIVSTRSRIEPVQRFQALPSAHPISYPIAILQNRFSASAAEVFAAALKQQQRAIVLGETSYGKGAVQKLFPLKQGALQLTVSHYYTPNGQMIEGKGIEADYSLNMSATLSEQQIQSQALFLFERYLSGLSSTKR